MSKTVSFAEKSIIVDHSSVFFAVLEKPAFPLRKWFEKGNGFWPNSETGKWKKEQKPALSPP